MSGGLHQIIHRGRFVDKVGRDDNYICGVLARRDEAGRREIVRDDRFAAGKCRPKLIQFGGAARGQPEAVAPSLVPQEARERPTDMTGRAKNENLAGGACRARLALLSPAAAATGAHLARQRSITSRFRVRCGGVPPMASATLAAAIRGMASYISRVWPTIWSVRIVLGRCLSGLSAPSGSSSKTSSARLGDPARPQPGGTALPRRPARRAPC